MSLLGSFWWVAAAASVAAAEASYAVAGPTPSRRWLEENPPQKWADQTHENAFANEVHENALETEPPKEYELNVMCTQSDTRFGCSPVGQILGGIGLIVMCALLCVLPNMCRTCCSKSDLPAQDVLSQVQPDSASRESIEVQA